MRFSAAIAIILLLLGLFGTNQARCQTPVQPPPTQPNQADPNAKPSDVQDPAKDPNKDPNKDPMKDPNAPQTENGDALGADSGEIAAQAPDYTGPAILSRNYALSRPAVPVNKHLTFYGGVNINYDSGIFGLYVPNVYSPRTSSGGVDINWGASATHYRRKDIFQFNYGGDYSEYFSTAKSSGLNQNFAGGYTRQLSPRLTVGLRETAALTTNNYAVLNSTVISDTSLASSTVAVAPNTESFNIRTYYSSTSGSLSYRKSARLSFSISGAFFLVRRDSADLADTNGYQAGADLAYRITQRQTLGLYYSHSEYSYKKVFGDSNADSGGMNYSISLSRNTDFSVRAGVTRYDSQTLAFVVPNPLVQQILGITEGIEKFYFVGYAPDVTATLNRKLRRSTVGATFTEGISPGNGLVLTSKSQSESVYWNLPAYRRWTSTLGAGRNVLSNYTSGPGDYNSYYATFSLSRPVTRYSSGFFNATYRQFGFNNTTFHQKEYQISLGVRFSPPAGTIKVW